MDFGSQYPDLEPLTKGASFNQLFDFFYTIGMIRYATAEMLRQISPKIGTKPKIQKLVDMGYLEYRQAYSLTRKAFDVIRTWNTAFLVKRLRADYSVHELKVSEIVLKMLDNQELFFIFYPTFKKPPEYREPYLNPDACLIFKSEDKAKARITFLEVEEEKPNWEIYLLDKKSKYEVIAADSNIHKLWWANVANKLGFRMCRMEEFCFSVMCIGNINYDWDGWEFIDA